MKLEETIKIEEEVTLHSDDIKEEIDDGIPENYISVEPEIVSYVGTIDLAFHQEPKGKRENKKKYKMHQCEECSYTGSTTALKYHVQAVHQGIKYPCDQCEFSATSTSYLKKHKEVKHNVPKFKAAAMCAAVTVPKKQSKFKPSPPRFECEQCGFGASNAAKLKRHIESKHKGFKFCCHICKFKAMTPELIRQHKAEKHGIGLNTLKIRTKTANAPTNFAVFVEAEEDIHLDTHISSALDPLADPLATDAVEDMEAPPYLPEAEVVMLEDEHVDGDDVYDQEEDMLMPPESLLQVEMEVDGEPFEEKEETANGENESAYELLDGSNVHINGSDAQPAEDFKNRLHECDQCDYKGHYNSFLYHKKSKHDGTRYTCDVCDYTASTVAYLKVHKRTKHEGIRYPCDECEFMAASTTYLKQHKKVKHLGIRYPCPACDFSGTTLSNLNAHIKKVHDEQRFVCNMCPYRTYSQLKLGNHKAKKHPEGKQQRDISDLETFPCPECNYEGSRLSHLKQHLRKKHNIDFDGVDGSEEIEEEDVYIETNSFLDQSLDQGPNSCEESHFDEDITNVDTEQGNYEELEGSIHQQEEEEDQQHMFNGEGALVEEESLGDGYVDERFPALSDDNDNTNITLTGAFLNVQNNLEAPRQLFPCMQCEYVGAAQCHLQTHITAKHASPEEKYRERKWPCDQCAYAAIKKSHLQRHRRSQHGLEDEIESGRKSSKWNFHPCEDCEYVATRKSHLKRHRDRMHVAREEEPALQEKEPTLIKPAKELKPTTELKTKEKLSQFPCADCSYVATRFSHLKRHAASKHEGVAYPCDMCDVVLTRSDHLSRHRRTQHGMVDEYYAEQRVQSEDVEVLIKQADPDDLDPNHFFKNSAFGAFGSLLTASQGYEEAA